VSKVAVNDLDRISRVIVPNNQLSLAIGKEGQNARLAARLTGWKIDIKSQAQATEDLWDSDFRPVDIKATKFFSSLLKPAKNKNKNKFNKKSKFNKKNKGGNKPQNG